MVTTLASNADILPEVEGFLKQTGLPVTTFGRRAIGDANLVENLRAGRELRRATRQKVRDFMREYRPDAPPPFPSAPQGTDHPAPSPARPTPPSLSSISNSGVSRTCSGKRSTRTDEVADAAPAQAEAA